MINNRQVELLEMRVEVALIQRSLELQNGVDSPNLKADQRSWKKLFDEKYRDRTYIGVFIMFFQRMDFHSKYKILLEYCPPRMVWY